MLSLNLQFTLDNRASGFRSVTLKAAQEDRDMDILGSTNASIFSQSCDHISAIVFHWSKQAEPAFFYCKIYS